MAKQTPNALTECCRADAMHLEGKLFMYCSKCRNELSGTYVRISGERVDRRTGIRSPFSVKIEVENEMYKV